MNKDSTMSYTDRLRDAFQRTENKKNASNSVDLDQMKHKTRNTKKEAKTEVYETLKSVQSPTVTMKTEKKVTKQDNGAQITRSQATDNSHTPRFEVYDSYTLVAKHSPSLGSGRPTSSNVPRSRSDQLMHPHQPVVTLKPHYGQNPSNNLITEATPKIIRTSTTNPEQNRSMSAVYRSQTRPEQSVHKSLSNRQQIIYQAAFRSQPRPPSAISKQYPTSAISVNHNYASLNRPKVKGPPRIADDNNVYYSLPRKTKTSSQNGGKYHGTTRRIPSKPLYIDTGSSRRTKTSPIKIPNTNSNTNNNSNNNNNNTATTSTDVTDENLINFSQTLARAATNSPPIKRRSSSLIHTTNPRVNARFATKSTIDEIYTQKNRKDNYEKYKKAANEILRENLALKFGENYPFNNQLRDSSLHSSTSSLSSTSSATDQQRSISSIPPDDIPLDIPNQNKDPKESFHASELFYPKKSPEVVKNDGPIELDDNTEVLEGTVTSDGNHLEIVNNVHLSDNDDNEDDSDEYDLDNDPSSSESYASDSDGDIEQFKKKFVPLHEIERMDDDFALENDVPELPDHQHSQSFRIENTSQASVVEVFVYKESLQRAKNALTTSPKQGILSIKSQEVVNDKKKRRAIFDPHILLLDACLEPDFEMVKDLIPRIANISRSTIDGITALHNAVCSADPRLVLFLIQSGANVNASDADGWTPLHCAACCNNKQISKILVDNGASLFAVTLSDNEIPSQKCNKTSQEDTQCEEYLFWEQEKLGMNNEGLVYALFDYVPQRPDELSLSPNQTLKVINTNPPGETCWFLAETGNGGEKRGFVAAAYVSCYKLTLPNHQ